MSGPSKVNKSARVNASTSVSASTNTSGNTTICAAIRNKLQPELRCLFRVQQQKGTSGQKYCPMHALQTNVVDYCCDDSIVTESIKTSIPIINPIIKNKIIKKKVRVEVIKKRAPAPVPAKKTLTAKPNYVEQKVETIEENHKENEEDLQVKLLILVNDYAYFDKIQELIGPVFDDVTISEDEEDIITMDPFWEMRDGVKCPINTISKYYLFSYTDSANKIRCLTIFTIKEMIDKKELVHPLTMEQIPEDAIERANKLIDIYQSKLKIFTTNNDSSPEYILKQRLIKFVEQFHVHSIYIDENWLLDINDASKLYTVIKETGLLIANNDFKKIFSNKKIFCDSKYNKSNRDPNVTLLEIKSYIVDEWDRIIKITDDPNDQSTIWLIIGGLFNVCPGIKEKYPGLEFM